MENVNTDAGYVGVGRTARVFPGVRKLGVLYEQVARGDVTLLRDHAHATAAGVVANHLPETQIIKKILIRFVYST